MSIYKSFGTNRSMEVDGIWIDYGEDCGRFRVARAGGSNKRYTARMEKVFRKHRRHLQLDIMREDDAQRLMREVFADTVILDWEGVTGEDGQPMEYTRDNVIKIFRDLPDLFLDLQGQARNPVLFRDAVDEGDSGN